MTKVLHLNTGKHITYSLPPKEAVVDDELHQAVWDAFEWLRKEA